MYNITSLLQLEPYSLSAEEKEVLILKYLKQLTLHHYEHCLAYQRIQNVMGVENSEYSSLQELPFLPVRLFKTNRLFSVPENLLVKTMTSSGTSGQLVSKIFLDRETSLNQVKVLSKIMGPILGGKRLPMLILDSRSVVKDRNLFSARGAGILGFSIFGHDIEYALDDDMKINIPRVEQFLLKHHEKNILMFGFTSIIWEHFIGGLSSFNKILNIKNGILIHGGGWKKLKDLNISNQGFKDTLLTWSGVNKVINYYGMVEQTGSIYMECEEGVLHSSIFSDIIFRRTHDFSECKIGELGIAQLLSVLPYSYPGHSILTEDMGRLLGEDDCRCGRLGKYFSIAGRVPNAEVRGCSDTYNSEGHGQ